MTKRESEKETGTCNQNGDTKILKGTLRRVTGLVMVKIVEWQQQLVKADISDITPEKYTLYFILPTSFLFHPHDSFM